MSFVLASPLLGGAAWAVSLDIDEHPVAEEHAPAQGTMLLDQASSKAEPVMGVLHIPLEEEVPGKADRAGSGAGDSQSLGFARVPLPAAAWLFGTAVVGIIAVSRRRPGRQFN